MTRNRGAIPLLASPQGGVAASSRRFRAATEADAAGVAFLFASIGKPPRPRDQRMLRDILLIARPPLLAVMQGGEWTLRNIRTFFTSSNSTPAKPLKQGNISGFAGAVIA